MWSELDKEQKSKYKEYCNTKYGKTIVSNETGEPIYIDKNGNLINTKIIIELLFSSQKN